MTESRSECPAHPSWIGVPLRPSRIQSDEGGTQSPPPRQIDDGELGRGERVSVAYLYVLGLEVPAADVGTGPTHPGAGSRNGKVQELGANRPAVAIRCRLQAQNHIRSEPDQRAAREVDVRAPREPAVGQQFRHSRSDQPTHRPRPYAVSTRGVEGEWSVVPRHPDSVARSGSAAERRPQACRRLTTKKIDTPRSRPRHAGSRSSVLLVIFAETRRAPRQLLVPAAAEVALELGGDGVAAGLGQGVLGLA